jgi:hypothetical protein
MAKFELKLRKWEKVSQKPITNWLKEVGDKIGRMRQYLKLQLKG